MLFREAVTWSVTPSFYPRVGGWKCPAPRIVIDVEAAHASSVSSAIGHGSTVQSV